MSATSPRPVAARRRPLPAEAPLWGFVLADMTVFGAFFVAYLWQLSEDRAGFSADASHLIVWLGLLNTLVLLTSSFLVVRATRARRAGAGGRGLLAAALVCAAVFACAKVAEYTLGALAGHTLTSSAFFMFYYVLTGLHLLHVAIGATILVVWRRSLRPGATPVTVRFAEGAGGYWHMVDLLWIILFSFLYIGSHA